MVEPVFQVDDEGLVGVRDHEVGDPQHLGDLRRYALLAKLGSGAERPRALIERVANGHQAWILEGHPDSPESDPMQRPTVAVEAVPRLNVRSATPL